LNDTEGFYEEHGYLGPATAFDAAELNRPELLSLVGALIEWPECRNRHLDTPAVAGLCQSERVTGRVRNILGPDLLLWRSNIFAMSTSGYLLPWHQDAYNDVLECRNGASHCSVQINLTDSSPHNCVAVIPGSHRWDADELHQRGYSLVSVREGGSNTPEYKVPGNAPTVDVPLKAGEFYVFHPKLLHASMLRPAEGAIHEAPDQAEAVRLSITLRIATPGCHVLSTAFAGTPTRAECVLLSGANGDALNPVGAWAA
jgi:hypothetical protein